MGAFEPSSYADPGGRLERLQAGAATVQRHIHPEHRAAVGRVLACGAVRALLADGRLVATRAPSGAPAPDRLEHDVVWPVTYPVEWLPDMLADAARLILEVARAIAPEQLVLADGTPRNVLFAGSRPVFVDFTAITPADGLPLWRAYDQFARECLHPLYAALFGATGQWRAAALTAPRAGLQASDVCAVMPAGFMLRHPLRAARLRIMSRLQSAPLPGFAAARTSANAPFFLDRLFRGLQREVDTLAEAVASRREVGWSRYYEEDTDADALARKVALVHEILEARRPRTVLDLGTNTGRFAKLAAASGACVVAADVDEPSLRRLYVTARRENLPITPVVMNAAAPSPAFGLGGSEFPPAVERLQCDTVLALGLLHHLALRYDYSLDRLVDGLAAFGGRTLVVEFVEAEDPRAQRLTAGARPQYRLDACRAALGRHYPAVRELPITATRTLLVAERPR